MAHHFLTRQRARFASGDVLTLERRRGINTMLVASAQEYCLAYRKKQIADMARLAMRKPVEQANFGLVEDCLRWQELAHELTARLNIAENFQERLGERARYLHGQLRFDEAASLPQAASLNTMPNRAPRRYSR